MRMLGPNAPNHSHESQYSETRYAPFSCSSGQTVSNHWQRISRPHFTPILILNDDCLLNIFHLCRPEEEVRVKRIREGGDWGRERWWYKLTHICQRWRFLILGSASYLSLSLVCTYGTPVAEMLAHSPPLPLTIDHLDADRNINAEEEERIMLALRCCNRVRRIRLAMPGSNLQKLIMAMDEEFPILEFLWIAPSTDHDAGLILPHAFQAPSLRHLTVGYFALPIGSPLLTTQVGLVTLNLNFIHSSAYFAPSELLQRLLHMPQLETLTIHFRAPTPNHEFQQLPTPGMPRTILPNLRSFGFGGYSSYLEELLAHISTPLLKKLNILYTDHVPFSVPHLGQFVATTKNLRENAAELAFREKAVTFRLWIMKPHFGARVHALHFVIVSRYLNSQAALAAQVFSFLNPVLSVVTELTLHWDYTWPHAADPSHWRNILRPFSNANALFVHSTLVRQISRCLQFGDGESAMELLPKLNRLGFYGSGEGDGDLDAFAAFTEARQNDGRPVTLVRVRH